MDPELKRQLDRIERLLRESIKVSIKKTWIKVSQVQQITPWKTKDQLRSARQCGLVVTKKDGNGIFYLLESIPQQFIILNKS